MRYKQISKEVIRRYVDREGNGAFANTAPSVSKRRLGETGQYLLALVLQFRDTAAAKLSSFYDPGEGSARSVRDR